MATYQSWEPESTTTRAGPRYPATEQGAAQSGDGAGRATGQAIGGLRQVWQRAQERFGLNDRQPSPTLNEELRQGQQEVRDIGRDIAGIAQDLQVLVRQEMLLARAEMQEQIRLSARAMGWSGLALIFLFLKFAFLAVAGMFALALVLPLWLSALITAGALLVLGAIAGLIAYEHFRRVHMVPRQTMESVKEDIRWLSDQLRSNGT